MICGKTASSCRLTTICYLIVVFNLLYLVLNLYYILMLQVLVHRMQYYSVLTVVNVTPMVQQRVVTADSVIQIEIVI